MTTYWLSIKTSEAIALEISECLSTWREDDPPTVSSFEEQDGGWSVAAYFQDVPDIAAIRSLLSELVEEKMLATLQVETLDDEDWVAASQRRLSPVHAGRFTIHGSHDSAALRGRLYAIEIDAGQAFGTAHHGTTRGCLIAIDQLLRLRRFERVLDIGTGSGVLAIAVGRVLRRPVILATDNDPIAVEVAEDNCRANGVGAFVSPQVAHGLDHPTIRGRAPFDLIIANILAGPLYGLAPGISTTSSLSGVVVLSGLLEAQAGKISARYRSLGFVTLKKISIEGWATLILQKRGSV